MGKTLTGIVVGVSAGGAEDLSKTEQSSIDVGFEGIKGDGHAGLSRTAYDGEREPEGTLLRNDRQWSGVAQEELAAISQALDLSEPLGAAVLGANLCVKGFAEFSLLPRGSRLKFPSGAALVVEEYNPPCIDMGEQIARQYRRKNGEPLGPRDWLKPASGRRGVVGVVDVPGAIRIGDVVTLTVFSAPPVRLFPVDD